MKWIKASERLPELPDILPENTPDERGILFINRTHSCGIFWYPSYGQHPTSIMNLNFEGWSIEQFEWLDESHAPVDAQPNGDATKLFSLLAQYGGEIVCSNNLSANDIAQARASERMYVDENSLGYVWIPTIKGFPETVEEVEYFERWYPLPVELPGSLKTLDWMKNKVIRPQPNGDEVVKEVPMEKPIGDFIFEQNTPHVQLPDGAYYHYSDVCTLLKKYRQPEVDALKNRVEELEDELHKIKHPF